MIKTTTSRRLFVHSPMLQKHYANIMARSRMEEGGRIERRALLAPPRFSKPLGHHCPAPSEIWSPCPDSNRLHPLTKRKLFLLSYGGGDDGVDRTRSLVHLQCTAFPFGYVVMVRDRRFERRFTRVRAEAIPDAS